MIVFMANENFPGDSVRSLREAGYDVLWIKEEAPGLDDGSILQWATRLGRVLLTQDRDYGELVFRYHFPAPAGVVYFRLRDRDAFVPARRLADMLADPDVTFRQTFAVVGDDSVRFVRLEM